MLFFCMDMIVKYHDLYYFPLRFTCICQKHPTVKIVTIDFLNKVEHLFEEVLRYFKTIQSIIPFVYEFSVFK